MAAGPRPQRWVLRALLEVARRPRGAELLARVWPLGQIVCALATLDHYEEPEVARSLGFDAQAVLARGSELRGGSGHPGR